MEYFGAIVNQILVFLLLLAAGYILRKGGMIDGRVTDGLFLIISTVGLSAATVVNMQKIPYSSSSFRSFGTAFLLYTACMVLGYLLIGLFMRKLEFPDRGIWVVSAGTSNIGFMGLSVISAVFGAEASFYVTAGLLASNIVVFTYGMFLLTYNKDTKSKRTVGQILKPMCSWVFIASILGFLLYLFSIRLPGPIYTSLEMMGSIITPVAMLAIGSVLADGQLKKLLSNRKLWWASLQKLLLVPLICYALFYFAVPNKELLAIVIIGLSMPTGNAVPSIVKQAGGDPQFSSEAVFHSTVASMVTIPCIVAVTTLSL